MPERSRRIIFWVAVTVSALCFGFLIWYLISGYRANQQVTELREEVSETAEPEIPVYTLEEVMQAEFTGERSGVETPIPKDLRKDAEECPIDFEKLKRYNGELYAWIKIPGTNVDYPVAQHKEDNEFYLHHDFYKNPQFSGCIYSEKPAAKDFSDPVTVLYGHNMADGSMFGSLREFRDTGFFDENRYVYVYTPYRTLQYEIYAAYQYDDRSLTESFDFHDPDDLALYIEESLHPRQMIANVKQGIDVTANDRILTLSTCLKGDTDERYLVQAVLKHETRTGKTSGAAGADE